MDKLGITLKKLSNNTLNPLYKDSKVEYQCGFVIPDLLRAAAKGRTELRYIIDYDVLKNLTTKKVVTFWRKNGVKAVIKKSHYTDKQYMVVILNWDNITEAKEKGNNKISISSWFKKLIKN